MYWKTHQLVQELWGSSSLLGVAGKWVKVSKKMFLKKEHDCIHHKWPSCHQWLIHISIFQSSGNTSILTHPPNQVGIYHIPIVYTWLKYYIILPMHSGGTIYIIWPKGIHKMTTIERDKLLHHETWYDLYMTFTTETKHLNKIMIVIRNYHTQCKICSISIYQQHLDQQPV